MSEANDLKIELLQEEDLDYVISMCEAIFREHDTMASDPLKMEFFTQLNVSYKALLNGEIIGCYLMNEDPVINEHEGFVINVDISPYDEKKGIHGVVSPLNPNFGERGMGGGSGIFLVLLAGMTMFGDTTLNHLATLITGKIRQKGYRRKRCLLCYTYGSE